MEPQTLPTVRQVCRVTLGLSSSTSGDVSKRNENKRPHENVYMNNLSNGIHTNQTGKSPNVQLMNVVQPRDRRELGTKKK